MNRRKIGSFVGCVLVTCFALACTKKDTETASTDTASSSAAATAPRPPKGPLPPGWQNYRSKQFRDSMETIGWTNPPTFGERKCEGSKTCREGAYISANLDARDITPAIAGVNGAVIAKMALSPTSSKTTTMYHLAPGAFTYYTVVTANAAGNGMNWQIIQVGDNGDAPITPVASGSFYECGDGKGPVAAADWNGCRSHRAHTGDPKVDSAEAIKIAKELRDTDGEGWVSCESGCCTLSPDKDPKNPKPPIPPLPDTGKAVGAKKNK